jgi:hypothetical protein
VIENLAKKSIAKKEALCYDVQHPLAHFGLWKKESRMKQDINSNLRLLQEQAKALFSSSTFVSSLSKHHHGHSAQ